MMHVFVFSVTSKNQEICLDGVRAGVITVNITAQMLSTQCEYYEKIECYQTMSLKTN
jgi:hypothetical protein